MVSDGFHVPVGSWVLELGAVVGANIWLESGKSRRGILRVNAFLRRRRDFAGVSWILFYWGGGARLGFWTIFAFPGYFTIQSFFVWCFVVVGMRRVGSKDFPRLACIVVFA